MVKETIYCLAWKWLRLSTVYVVTNSLRSGWYISGSSCPQCLLSKISYFVAGMTVAAADHITKTKYTVWFDSGSTFPESVVTNSLISGLSHYYNSH